MSATAWADITRVETKRIVDNSEAMKFLVRTVIPVADSMVPDIFTELELEMYMFRACHWNKTSIIIKIIMKLFVWKEENKTFTFNIELKPTSIFNVFPPKNKSHFESMINETLSCTLNPLYAE